MPQKTFTPDAPALPMNYPSFVFRMLREEGHSADALLANTGLNASHLGDPHFRSGYQPLRQLLLNAIAETGEPHLGVRLALRFQPTYIGLPAYAAMNAPSFEAGLAVLSRFFPLNFPAFDLSVVDGPSTQPAEEAALRLRSKFPLIGLEYFSFSSALIAINGLLQAMLRVDTVALRAEMTADQPEGWQGIDPTLGFPVRFQASENRLVFPAELKSRLLPGADPLNHERLVALCEAAASEASYLATPVTQVTSLLEDAQTYRLPLSEVAARLGYSERGLRRDLERCGTSYRKLVDQIRLQHAREMLLNTTLPIQTIAERLGFESPSNFGRSFKRWTGITPKAFRHRP